MRLNKGDVVTIHSKKLSYGNKARPVIVYQNNLFNEYVESVNVIPLTSVLIEANTFRILLLPDKHNGLLQESQAMVDKITTYHQTDIGKRVGHINIAQLVQINQAVGLWLDL